MKPRERSSSAVAAAILAPIVMCMLGCGDDSPSSEQEPAVVAQAQALLQTERIPGLAAAIVTRNAIVWERAFGYANIEAQRPVTVDTPFALASVSKTVLGAAVMKAVERHRVTLDTDINSVGLPFVVDNPNVNGEHILLRHLVTHTSGILDDINLENLSGSYACSYYVEADGSPLADLLTPNVSCPKPAITDLNDYLDAYLTKRGTLYSSTKNYSVSPPGAAWNYSNVGAALAARVLEAAIGESFDLATEHWLFEPLGMRNTHWHRSQFPNPAVVASQYAVSEGELIELPEYSLATWPDGGLRSSAHDLAKFAGALLNGGTWRGARVLSAQSVNTLLSAQPAVSTGDPTIKQGIFWVDWNGSAYHNGEDPGTTTVIQLDPSRTVGVVLMMNIDFSDQSAIQQLVDELMRLGRNLAKR